MSIHGRMRSLARAGGFALLTALVPAGCVELTAVQEDGSFQLQVGDRAQSGDFTVHFVSVPHDSRCPYDVTCTWPGDAVVRLDLSTHHYSELMDLHLNSAQGPTEEELDGHVVELLDLLPEPFSGHSIPQGDYTARLRVSHF